MLAEGTVLATGPAPKVSPCQLDLDPGVPQLLQAGTVHARRRIECSGHHPDHAGLQQRRGAGRSAAEMAAGLEGDVRGGPDQPGREVGASGGLHGHHFGVVEPGAGVVALPEHPILTGHHGPHDGVGTGSPSGLLRQEEGPFHLLDVEAAQRQRKKPLASG